MTIILTTLLILLCLVIVLLILIQRTSGGMGSALGGGAADQVLGAGSAAQLTKLTVWGILGFFDNPYVIKVWTEPRSTGPKSMSMAVLASEHEKSGSLLANLHLSEGTKGPYPYSLQLEAGH